MRCDIVGECSEPAVRRFQHVSWLGEVVTLWACREHARWWRTRHPEVNGAEGPTPILDAPTPPA